MLSSVVSLAHNIRGVSNPTLAVARLSSSTSSVDRPQPLGEIWHWPVSMFRIKSLFDARITAVGLDLPGDLGGFALVSPVGAGFELENEVGQIPGFPLVSLDFALLTGRTFASGDPGDGLPPSTTQTQVCVSGPFPRDPADPSLFLPIEKLLDYSICPLQECWSKWRVFRRGRLGVSALCFEARRDSSLRSRFHVITDVSEATAFGCREHLVIERSRFAPINTV